MALTCGSETRRRAVRDAELNGLDYLEVGDDQRTLTITFIGKAPRDVGAANVRIDGDGRPVHVQAVRLCVDEDPERDDCLHVTVDRPGDFSCYTLRLVEVGVDGRPSDVTLFGLDPRYAALTFSFKVNCPTDLDCVADAACDPPLRPDPEISYLAKDYASFRQLVLDRLALTMPDWRDREIPDLGMTLVELLAYVGDELSYHQDAVGTEAYLDTARRRVSVRRHTRLLDYPMHDGCNARAWVFVETSAPVPIAPDTAYFVTGVEPWLPLAPAALRHLDLAEIPAGSYEVFEPMLSGPVTLRPEHNAIHLWTWGNRDCCLPRGATRATLTDAWTEPLPADAGGEDDTCRPPTTAGAPPPERPRALRLAPGDLLLFEEIRSPTTGDCADADPTHRQVVRLTRVSPAVDALYDRPNGQPIVEIEWTPADALTFPLCISAIGGPACDDLTPVSVARGNVVLVDHGRSVPACGGTVETLAVPGDEQQTAGCDGWHEPRRVPAAPRPCTATLSTGPLTHRVPFPAPASLSAGQAARLARLPDEIRAHLLTLWEAARAGQLLDADALAELTTLFGARTLTDVGLEPASPARRPTPDDHARALAVLVGHFDRLARAKLARLAVLGGHARAGYVLGPDDAAEVAESVGERYAHGLERTNGAYLGAARDAMVTDPHDAGPALLLHDVGAAAPEDTAWTPQRDLLRSGPRDRHVVVEIEDDGRATLRFGDGEQGAAPRPGSSLAARYRIGNGTAGNVGAETISHVVFCGNAQPEITAVRNPLPAQGGGDPEPLAHVRLFAPGALRRLLLRAVTAEDYAELAGALPGVQRAAAVLQWTGSWYEARVVLDPAGTTTPAAALLTAAAEVLHRRRRMGHDLVVGSATYVGLDVEILVRVRPHYLNAHVKAALLDVFGSRTLPGGRRGFFHPDNLTFGDKISVSRLVGAAQAVDGVESVTVQRLARLGEGSQGEVERGLLVLRPLEIARADNDPRHPENGRITLDVRGGR